MRVKDSKGCMYFMDDGTKLIDMCSGNFDVSLGHGHPVVLEAKQEFSGLSYPVFLDSYWYDKLGTSLHNLCPHMSQWHFTSSYSMAVELSIMAAMENRLERKGKVARRVFTLPGSHFGTSFATGHFHFNMDSYRRQFEIVEVQPEWFSGDNCPRDIFEMDFDAFIVEPINKLTGFSVHPMVLQRLREWCQKNGSYLIVDESYCSLSRCGIEGTFSGTHSDIVLIGRHLGQGLPIHAIGLHGFEEKFEPEVGWPGVLPSHCAVAHRVLWSLGHSGAHRKAVSLGGDWFNAFSYLGPDYFRVFGSLIYLNCGRKAATVWDRLYNKEKILVGSVQGSPWLMFMPCFITPIDINERVIKSVQKVLEEEKVSFGPSDTSWTDQETAGSETTKIEELAMKGQAGLTDLDITGAGENSGSVPLENPAGERIGSVNDIHASLDGRLLLGTVVTTRAYKVDQLTTEFATDKRKVLRVVLVK